MRAVEAFPGAAVGRIAVFGCANGGVAALGVALIIGRPGWSMGAVCVAIGASIGLAAVTVCGGGAAVIRTDDAAGAMACVIGVAARAGAAPDCDEGGGAPLPCFTGVIPPARLCWRASTP